MRTSYFPDPTCGIALEMLLLELLVEILELQFRSSFFSLNIFSDCEVSYVWSCNKHLDVGLNEPKLLGTDIEDSYSLPKVVYMVDI